MQDRSKHISEHTFEHAFSRERDRDELRDEHIRADVEEAKLYADYEPPEADEEEDL
jgi:hypothetical protein